MISLTFTDGGLLLSLSKAPEVKTTQLTLWLQRVVAHVHQALGRNMAGGLIGRRSGNLSRAIQERVVIDGTQFVGEVFPDPDKAIYGAIQEEGGTVLPKKGRALAIPLEAMQTSNGVARGSAGQVKASPSAFGYQGTFVRNDIIFGRNGTSVVPLFALKPSVTIPGKHYLEITLKQEWAWIANDLEKVTGEIVNVLFQSE